MKIINYYSNIDPKIWFDLCKQSEKDIPNADILSSINSYNLLYHINNVTNYDIKNTLKLLQQ